MPLLDTVGPSGEVGVATSPRSRGTATQGDAVGDPLTGSLASPAIDPSLSPDSVLRLQGVLGNAAVQRMLVEASSTPPQNTGPLIVQRDNDGGAPAAPPASTPATPPAQSLPPEAAQQLAIATTTLTHVDRLSDADRELVQRAITAAPVTSLIQERDEKQTQLRLRRDELNEYRRQIENPPENGTPPNQDMVTAKSNEVEALNTDVQRLDGVIQATITSLGLSNVGQLASLVLHDFPERFIERGKQIARSELDQNKAIVEQEVQRYGLNACVDPAAREGLKKAAADLVEQDRKIQDVRDRLEIARSDAEPPQGGVPDPASLSSSHLDVRALSDELNRLTQAREDRLHAAALQYPVLLQQSLDLHVLATGSDTQFEEMLGGKLQEILDNIETTRQNIDSGRLKIWNLHNVIEMTTQDMGVGSSPVLQAAIQHHIQQEEADEATLKIALAALAITAGIVATVATGGVALAAGAVALGVGGYQATQSVQNYIAESAASNIALDPAVADLSKREPELLWLILDIVAVVLDAAQVVRIFNELRAAARATMEAGEMAQFAQAARRALPAEGADRVIASMTRQRGVANQIERTVEAIGAQFRHADLVDLGKRIEQLADEGFHAVYRNLTAQGRIRPLTREAFVEVFGEQNAAQRIAAGQLSYDGLYIPESGGSLFIKPGAFDSVASTIVHESTHWIQTTQGAGLARFMEEFQAFSMEQRYVRRLVQDGGVEAVPGDLMWLVSANDERIAERILENYHDVVRPESLDGAAAVQDVLNRLQVFH